MAEIETCIRETLCTAWCHAEKIKSHTDILKGKREFSFPVNTTVHLSFRVHMH